MQFLILSLLILALSFLGRADAQLAPGGIRVTNLPTAADANAVAVRCVNTAGSAFEACGGASGGDGKILDGTGAGQADVMASAPSGTEEGLVVRNIPSGTQPVSAASLPLPTGAATAALQTQPGVDIGDVTINNAAGASAVNIQDGGNVITVDGTVTTTPPANATTNVTQFGGTNVSTGTGVGGAGIPRVTISNDSSLAANQSVNMAQINGSTAQVATNSLNTTGAGLIAGALVGQCDDASPTALTENQFGHARINCGTHEQLVQLSDGTTKVAVIAGTTALKTDLSSVAGTATVTAAAGVQKVGIVGNANAALDAANNAAAPANVLVAGVETATQTVTQPTAATTGNVRRAVAATDGVLYAKLGGPLQWQCNLGGIGTTLTECRAAPGAGLRLYITDIVAISTTTTSGLFTLRFGTGTNCATAPGNVFFASAAATIPNAPNNAVGGPNTATMSFLTPIAITANNAVCVLGVATNTTNIQIGGYTAP